MSLSIHCTLFLPLASLFLSSFCIRSAPASPSPPSFYPATNCPPPDAANSTDLSCPSLPSPLSAASWPPPSSTSPIENISLPLVNQSCLFVYTHLSSSSPFTIDFTNELFEDCPPSLAFAFGRFPQVLFIKLIFDFTLRDSCAAAEQHLLLLAAYNEFDQGADPIQTPTNTSCKETSLDCNQSAEGKLFNYSVSLAYTASSAALGVQAWVRYGGGLDINQTFLLNTTHNLQRPHDEDDNIDLSIGFVTRGEATINLNDAPSPIDVTYCSLSSPPPPTQNKSKSTHIKVVVWVVVGVSMVAFLVVLMILALTIKKYYRKRRGPLVSSRLAGGNHVGPPLAPIRAPFPYPHRESSATPMMNTLCLSPPYHTDNFQLSGTASWLKQPNPR